ncbi:MAG: signal recognition particle subunit SRP19 [Halanaeroarchaeum sp.]
MVENIIWPAYLDATRSRSAGRRVATDVAIESPTLEEIANAVQQVGYDAVIERDASYPRTPWRNEGRVVVKQADDATKSDLLQAVAAYVRALRD